MAFSSHAQMWVQYSTANQLPSNNVTAKMVEDDQKNVWLIAGGKLIKHTGAGTIINVSETENLPQTFYSMEKNSRNEIFFLCANDSVLGYFYKSSAFTILKKEKKIALGGKPLIFVDRFQNFWISNGQDFGFDQYLYEVKNGVVSSFPLFSIIGKNYPVTQLYHDFAGNLWASVYEHGAVRYDYNEWKNYSASDQSYPLHMVNNVISDTANSLIYLFRSPLLYTQSGTVFTRFVPESDFDYSQLIQTKNGDLWAIRSFGLWNETASSPVFYQLKKGAAKWIYYQKFPGYMLTYNDKALVETGNVIYTNSSAGIYSFNGTAWKTITTADGLASNSTNNLMKDSKNNVYALHPTDVSILNFNSTKWEKFSSISQKTISNPNSVFEDSRGQIYITSGSGLYKYANEGTVLSNEADQVESIFAVYPNPANSFINVKGNYDLIVVTDSDSKEVGRYTSNRIDVSGYKKGNYFISVNYKGRSAIQKIVVQ